MCVLIDMCLHFSEPCREARTCGIRDRMDINFSTWKQFDISSKNYLHISHGNTSMQQKMMDLRMQFWNVNIENILKSAKTVQTDFGVGHTLRKVFFYIAICAAPFLGLSLLFLGIYCFTRWRRRLSRR